MAIELVTYADLKNLLELEGTLISEYPALSLLRDSVTDAIEAEIDRELESKERTEYIHVGSTNMAMVPLRGLPVASISSVKIETDDIEETLSSGDYTITNYGLRLGVTSQNSLITVVYTGGYEDADVPGKLSRAALLQTAYEFQNKSNIGATSIFTEGGSTNTPELGLLAEVRRMLQNFKHPLMVI